MPGDEKYVKDELQRLVWTEYEICFKNMCCFYFPEC